jgi:simple sugar transport system permease protein
VGGATLVIAQAGAYADGITAGRGYIAVAVVALGRWRPTGVAAGALIFGAVGAIQFLAQAVGWNAPYSLILAAPYVAALVALTLFRGAGAAPTALAKPLEPMH